MIRLDLTGLTAAAIGGAGLSDREVREGLVRGEAAAAAVRADHGEGRAGFLALPADRAGAGRVGAFAARAAPRFENAVVLGIGGSALGARMLHGALLPAYANLLPREARGGRPRLFVYDNVDPAELEGLLRAAPPERTLWNVVSKSGSTAETLAALLVVWDRLRRAVGEKAREHVAITTDPANGPLREIARTEGIEAFDVPGNVGGRFSVLSPVGLVPAALAGIDIEGLLDGAAAMARRCLEAPAAENPGIALAAAHLLFSERGRTITVLMPYAAGLRAFAEWFAQLWAESLGKRRADGRPAGLTPARALGVTDQHSQLQLYLDGPGDKVVGFVSVDDPGRDVAIPAALPGHPAANYLGGAPLGRLLDVERRATAAALLERRRPHWTLHLPRLDAPSVGAAIILFEHAAAVLGRLLGIDPYDQPAVEVGKRRADATLGRPGADPALALPPPSHASGGWVV